jgi:hypothetical protein
MLELMHSFIPTGHEHSADAEVELKEEKSQEEIVEELLT